MKKLYIEPEMEIITIKLNEDVLTSSQESPIESTGFTEPEIPSESEPLPWG